MERALQYLVTMGTNSCLSDSNGEVSCFTLAHPPLLPSSDSSATWRRVGSSLRGVSGLPRILFASFLSERPYLCLPAMNGVIGYKGSYNSLQKQWHGLTRAFWSLTAISSWVVEKKALPFGGLKHIWRAFSRDLPQRRGEDWRISEQGTEFQNCYLG